MRFIRLKLLNMASQRIDGVKTMENASATSSHPGFSSDKYTLLVVVGEHTAAGSVEYLVSEIERGKVGVFFLINRCSESGGSRASSAFWVRSDLQVMSSEEFKLT